MKLSVIIVNYNVQYFLENCLNSVCNSSKNIEFEVIVVDNNSVDGSLEMLKEKFPHTYVIVNKDNKGFSKANNQAIKIAKGEYVVLLNPDTVVEENTFKLCCDFMDANPKSGGLGVKMLDGNGNFLPESKRGLPTPAVAFYKIFGLSALFPKSEKFGQYHLGHLSKDENHEIEILSGAFMMMRKSLLDKIGLLDESFFMYGEDIDLSYRITQAGYTNHYFSGTQIIHYKGESTKKSSINYVFVFYRAMAIFAKKHFSNKNAQLFSTLINFAIYIRAGLAVLTRTIKYFLLPILDGVILGCGVYFFKEYYEYNVKFTEGGAYPEEVETYGIPIILLIYLFSLLFNGAYSIPTSFKKIVTGVVSGSVFLLIGYSLLSENYRFSRAIIIFTVLFATAGIPLLRYFLHLIKIRKFTSNRAQRIAIVGKADEVNRISSFIKNTLINPEKIINVNAENEGENNSGFSARLYQLKDIIDIYDINEVIFCAKDLRSAQIIDQMGDIKKDLDFKIAPPESLYIIGSNSIESSGEYYIMASDTILKPVNQKNKRILDFCLSLFFLLLSPLFFWFVNNKRSYFSNLLKVLLGAISFVGFYTSDENSDKNLKVKRGILNPTDLHDSFAIDQENIEQLNFEYGRDYAVAKDLEIVFKNIGQLGR
ncbi:glycosyltransferase family 2 protein [Vicingaceae bacterium]|nr:glycosyltransferase family 2 protein [Vicingaceae bacterium]MDB4060720.1 glycosyltransferase family 2 protein [Vicingaceae bacterium]MDC1451996.1 glycosyltransferase family 2 protein [Vicingaceae bacterium]